MSTITPPVNIPASIVSAGLSTLYTLGVGALEAALNTYFPFTAIPGVKQVIDWFINWALTTILTPIGQEATILVIQFESYLEKTNYVASAGALQAAQASGNSSVISQAQIAFDAAADKEIQSNGVLP